MSQTEIRNVQNTTPFTGPNLLGPEYKNDESPLATPLSHMNNGQEVPEEFKTCLSG